MADGHSALRPWLHHYCGHRPCRDPKLIGGLSSYAKFFLGKFFVAYLRCRIRKPGEAGKAGRV